MVTWTEDNRVVAKRGIVFMAWGERHAQEVQRCLLQSELPDYPIFLITDESTDVSAIDTRVTVMRRSLELRAKAKKCEIGKHLPEGFDSLLYLDVDARVLGDISLGFGKAEQHGIAMAQAAHYSLDHFYDFASVMVQEGVQPHGQLLYNSGVIFLSLTEQVRAVLALWENLARKHAAESWSDQPYLTLAMELLGFSPYTLSTGYNHRSFGELISGEIRIWHSWNPIPANLNEMDPVFPRRYEGGRIVDARRRSRLRAFRNYLDRTARNL